MISLLLLLALVVSTEGCSLAEPPPKISMEANMYNAPVVVYARYESPEPFNDTDGYEAENARLRLRCIFKSDQNIVGDTIRIYRYQPQSTCSGTDITVGKDYLFTLKRSTERDETDMYDLVEGVAQGTAAYEYEDGLVDRVVRVCGLEDPQDPTIGCGPSWTCCPTPMPSNETCVTDAAVNATKNIHTILLAFIFVIAVLVH